MNSGDGIDYHQRFSENIGDLIEVNIGEHWQTLANIIYYIFQNICYLTWQMTNVDVMFQSRATLVTVEKTQKTRFLLILSTSDNSLGSKYEGSELTSWDNKLWWHSSTMSVVGNIKGQLKACSDNIKGQKKESLFRQKYQRAAEWGKIRQDFLQLFPITYLFDTIVFNNVKYLKALAGFKLIFKTKVYNVFAFLSESWSYNHNVWLFTAFWFGKSHWT